MWDEMKSAADPLGLLGDDATVNLETFVRYCRKKFPEQSIVQVGERCSARMHYTHALHIHIRYTYAVR